MKEMIIWFKIIIINWGRGLIVKKLDEPRSYLVKINRTGVCYREILNIPRK